MLVSYRMVRNVNVNANGMRIPLLQRRKNDRLLRIPSSEPWGRGTRLHDHGSERVVGNMTNVTVGQSESGKKRRNRVVQGSKAPWESSPAYERRVQNRAQAQARIQARW